MSPSRALLALPNETLTIVFEYLEPDTLANLVRVCRRLQGVGERILYTTITILESVDGPESTIITPYKTLGCCSAIETRPYLASVIKKFALRWTRDRARHHDLILGCNVIQHLRYILRLASNIESLELCLTGYGGSFEDILRGATLRLHNLSLSGPVNSPIEWFLRIQPGINHLHLADQHLPLVLHPSNLPILHSFRGDTRTAASILPNRPVTSLSLSGYEPTEKCLQAFAFASSPIRKLDLGSVSVTPTHMLNISKYLTAVECLRMRLALRHTLHFTFSGMMLLAPLTQVLRAFHSLAWLDLSPTSVDGMRGSRVETDESSLCATWAQVCPSLRWIKFPSGTGWALSPDGVWRSQASAVGVARR